MVNIKEIRIGLIGAGWMGRTHANSLLNAYRLFGGQYGKPVFEIVSDVSESAASATAEQLGFARWTTDWRDVVNDERIDVVDIAAWNAFHYEVAKAALEASVRYLAADLGPRGVRVNAISAGPIRTLAAKGIKDFNSILKQVEEKAPLRRNTEASEVGDTALFLMSDWARGITGEVIYVDSGYHILGV